MRAAAGGNAHYWTDDIDFQDPVRGRVLLDGVDLRSLATADLRSGVVLVPQENFLFSGTVAANIAVAYPAATPEQIQWAAEATGIHGYISTLKDGYRTDVGDRGGRFSAGQRQLIALARVFLVNPSVIVLDEAVSAIDIPSERAVHDAMRAVLRGRTALVTACRRSRSPTVYSCWQRAVWSRTALRLTWASTDPSRPAGCGSTATVESLSHDRQPGVAVLAARLLA